MFFVSAFARVLSLIFNFLIQSYLQINSFISLLLESNCPIPFLYNIGSPCLISKLVLSSSAQSSYNLKKFPFDNVKFFTGLSNAEDDSNPLQAAAVYRSKNTFTISVFSWFIWAIKPRLCILVCLVGEIL